MQLSEHFAFEEFIFSQTAVRNGIDNTPNQQQIQNLRALCESVLEPIRTLIKQPLHISSGYRSPQLNKAIGGATNSQHMEGKAADIVCLAMDTPTLFKQIVRSGIVFDQLIFEGTWVHVSYNPPGNRAEILKATFQGGRATYARLTREAALAIA